MAENSQELQIPDASFSCEIQPYTLEPVESDRPDQDSNDRTNAEKRKEHIHS